MAAISFEDLNLSRPLLDALSDLGFQSPTTIQQKAFSTIMSGKDVCGIAQTGTGKTYAYLLPLLRQWQYSKDRLPQMLVIVPTRELVAQVVEAASQLAAYQSLKAVGVFGGVNLKPQAAEIEQGADIIVATPGRLLDLILNGALKTKAIRKLVIDEMDELLNLGFRPQLQRVLDLLPPRRQNLLFSATITDEVETVLDTFFNNPVRIEAAPTGTPLENIAQSQYEVPNFNTKINLLKVLLQDEAMTRVMVFAATKNLADQIFEQIEAACPDAVGVIHSNKEQNHRFNTISRFKDGSYRLIIATDIIARGIDVSEVSHVINFDLPEVPEHYMHRIGRTGRADRQGIAISFVTERETERLKKIEALMNYEVPVLPLPDSVEISDVLTADELPKVHMKNIQIRRPKTEDAGAAFHEKSAKNSKVNVKIRHADKMKAKYGKPKTRGAKKK